MDLTRRVEELGRTLGFDLVGIAGVEPSPETSFLREWIARDYAGEMAYLGRRVEERVDPRRVLSGARSLIVVGLVYDPDLEETAAGSEGDPEPRGRIARYAGGDDYHEVISDRLDAFAAGLEPLAGRPVGTRSYVDTGPVLERVHAAYAGLGWIGKNTCLIHPRLGSYLFLGVLLTDLELGVAEREPDHCGSCRACLDVCPTDAFPEPYVMDARRCLSYTTIELRGPIPEEMREPQGDWVFGCDLCQEVCPWNTRTRRSLPDDLLGLRKKLAPRAAWRRPTLRWLLELDESDWRDATRHTALRRSKHHGLLRNSLIAAGNSGDVQLADAVRRHLGAEDPVIAEHARWALARLSP